MNSAIYSAWVRNGNAGGVMGYVNKMEQASTLQERQDYMTDVMEKVYSNRTRMPPPLVSGDEILESNSKYTAEGMLKDARPTKPNKDKSNPPGSKSKTWFWISLLLAGAYFLQ